MFLIKMLSFKQSKNIDNAEKLSKKLLTKFRQNKYPNPRWTKFGLSYSNFSCKRPTIKLRQIFQSSSKYSVLVCLNSNPKFFKTFGGMDYLYKV